MLNSPGSLPVLVFVLMYNPPNYELVEGKGLCPIYVSLAPSGVLRRGGISVSFLYE